MTPQASSSSSETAGPSRDSSVHERHLQNYPGATISAAELDYLNHISRSGRDAYPVRKLGRSWFVEAMYGVGGCQKPFKTQREAFGQVELYCSLLRDKAAGREPGTGEVSDVMASDTPQESTQNTGTSETSLHALRELAAGMQPLRWPALDTFAASGAVTEYLAAEARDAATLSSTSREDSERLQLLAAYADKERGVST